MAYFLYLVMLFAIGFFGSRLTSSKDKGEKIFGYCLLGFGILMTIGWLLV